MIRAMYCDRSGHALQHCEQGRADESARNSDLPSERARGNALAAESNNFKLNNFIVNCNANSERHPKNATENKFYL